MHTRGLSSGSLARRGCGRRGEFFGMDIAEMSRASRVAVALAVISSVALSGLLLFALAPGAWWVLTIYGWVVFPAIGLLGKGVSGRPEKSGPAGAAPVASKEQQLLEALERNGSLTPTRAAIETSLSVAEAERMLRSLAESGHLEVRVRDGGIFYSMWETGEKEITAR